MKHKEQVEDGGGVLSPSPISSASIAVPALALADTLALALALAPMRALCLCTCHRIPWRRSRCSVWTHRCRRWAHSLTDLASEDLSLTVLGSLTDPRGPSSRAKSHSPSCKSGKLHRLGPWTPLRIPSRCVISEPGSLGDRTFQDGGGRESQRGGFGARLPVGGREGVAGVCVRVKGCVGGQGDSGGCVGREIGEASPGEDVTDGCATISLC